MINEALIVSAILFSIGVLGVLTRRNAIILFVLPAIFVAGLMMGRTPEYRGKKIEGRETRMAVLAILILPSAMLILTAIAVVLPAGVSQIGAPGPHGFSGIL